MNAKILRSLAAASVVTSSVVASLAHPVLAESLGEHPAVLVARTWSTRAIDPNTFVVLHPAGPIWLNASPTAKENNATPNPPPRTAKTVSASSK